MATSEQIALLRQLISEADESNGWTDVALGALIDRYTADGISDLDWAASEVWTQKASAVAELVDMSENGSTRKMSDVHKNFLGMASFYRRRSPGASAEDGDSPRPRTRAIVRP